jgi:hypothetical protein
VGVSAALNRTDVVLSAAKGSLSLVYHYCLGTCETAAENGAFGGLFSASFPHPVERSGRLSRRPRAAPGRINPQLRASSPVLKTAPHLSFCSMKAQTGSLHNLVASRVLFKGRVRPLSVEDGSPQLSQFYPAQRACLKLGTDLNLSSGCSVGTFAISSIQPSPSPQA